MVICCCFPRCVNRELEEEQPGLTGSTGHGCPKRQKLFPAHLTSTLGSVAHFLRTNLGKEKPNCRQPLAQGQACGRHVALVNTTSRNPHLCTTLPKLTAPVSHEKNTRPSRNEGHPAKHLNSTPKARRVTGIRERTQARPGPWSLQGDRASGRSIRQGWATLAVTGQTQVGGWGAGRKPESGTAMPEGPGWLLGVDH